MFFFIETLGCSRNKVDSAILIKYLKKMGFIYVNDPSKAVVIFVNTCGFIGGAISESINIILKLSKLKKNETCKKIYIFGCMAKRFETLISEIFYEIDYFGGIDEIYKIINFFILDITWNSNNNKTKKKLLEGKKKEKDFDDLIYLRSMYSIDRLRTVSYLKISEGCDGHCTYCIIPRLKGKHRSRLVVNILSEAKNLINIGIKELVLIAQDSTNYGFDLFKKFCFHFLLINLLKFANKFYIKFLYSNSETINYSTIKVIVFYKNLCPYFDIPIQHVSKNILIGMGRNYRKKYLTNIFKTIKCVNPVSIIRTTLLVGFPGEFNYDYIELVDFIDLIKFDNLGVFIYSNFKDLRSFSIKNKVNREIATYRRNVLMFKQLRLSNFNLCKLVGQNIEVLLNSYLGDNLYVGKSIMQISEVDGIIYVMADNTNIEGNVLLGEIVLSKLISSSNYDLIGKVYR